MKVLITPMAAMAETSGPYTRSAALCRKLLERGHKAAFCAAEDGNFKPLDNVRNYYAPIPSPLGKPLFIGKRIIKIAQLLNVQEKKNVHSYEQVLHFVGAIHKKYFSEDVASIRKSIREYRPDIVYAEFRISAIVASKLEHTKVVTGYSFPVQKSFASNPEYSADVKEYLQENHLPAIESVLDIFNWADLKIVPSSYTLEPIGDKNAVFTGPFFTPTINNTKQPKNKIVAYMGYGTITPKLIIHTLSEVFEQTGYTVFIASKQVKPFQHKNIIVDKRFDFNELMPQTAAFINHGGQNSIMTGLLYGVPQIICPGTGFERKYNAASIAKLGAGIQLKTENFNSNTIQKAVFECINQPDYAYKAQSTGKYLLSLGGTDKAVDILENSLANNHDSPDDKRPGS